MCGIMPESSLAASRKAALVGVMAAVYYVFLWLPNVPAVGIPEVKIDLGASFAPILGLLLGPYLGFLAALVGDVVKFLTTPSVYSIPFLLCPPVSAFAAGYLARNRWKEPFILLILLLTAATFTPVFFPVTEHYVVYLLGFFDKIFALLLIPLVPYFLRKSGKLYHHTALFIAMFVGNETDASLGNLVFSLPVVYKGIFGIPDANAVRGLFTISPLVYPAIRVLQAFLGYLIAFSLLRVTAKVRTLREFIRLHEIKVRV